MSNAKPASHRLARRDVLRTAAAGALGTALPTAHVSAASSAPVRSQPTNALAASLPIWKLDRPRPALPNSYFWTWDHSTNWVWDDPGMLNYGCLNRYLKRPETYLEDYRRLTDLAAGLGVRGYLIWGFLRDAHGGIEYGKRVADYAASRGVALMPGVGTTWYGGAYYEGNDPHNLETFIKRYPEACRVDEQGNHDPHGMCPTHPGFVAWLQNGVHWLFKEFNIGGVNLENGDFVVCHCPRCKKLTADWPKGEPEFWRHQVLGYQPALQALSDQMPASMVTWATYKGFLPGTNGNAQDKYQGAYLECTRPSICDKLDPRALCQWTLTHMLRQQPVPLTIYLDDGAPAQAFDSANYPVGIKPPTTRNVGFIHQGSQWTGRSRYNCVVSTIKEGCLRAYRSGLEGVSIHGEVSSMHVPYALNYLAFSHFIHWPEDSLRQFGRKTLGQILGSEAEGEAFAEHFAHYDAGSLTDPMKKDIAKRAKAIQMRVSDAGKDLQAYRFWNWLDWMAAGQQDRQTVSLF